MNRFARTTNRVRSYLKKEKRRFQQWWRYCSSGVWNDTRRNWKVNIIKIVNLSIRSFLSGDLQSKACAMTYRTILALVPALALLCAIARGFGYQQTIVDQLIAQLPAQEDALKAAFGFVDDYLAQSSGGVFVGVGIVFLLWTVIALIRSIEMAFNSIWQVEKGRSLWRMATDYLAIIVILPILLICSNGLTIVMNSTLPHLLPFEFMQPAIETLLDVLSLVVLWLFFTGTFMLIPNTKVRFRTAIIPGILVGSACQLLQWAFISGQIYVARYNAIYGSFSFLPLLLIWMQCVWLLTLTGGVLCYAIQNMGEYNFSDTIRSMSDRYRYQTSLAVMTIIAQRFDKSLGALNASEMGQKYRMPVNLINPEIERLRAVGLVNYIDGDGRETTDRKVQPAENVAKLTITDVVERLSDYGSKDFIADFKTNFKPIESIFKSIGKSLSEEGAKTRLIDIPIHHIK